ncbi:Similar to Scpep1: Retinoid-inducible serine carboxypeptidase (Mus musculus), partial [Cotesia congregata]
MLFSWIAVFLQYCLIHESNQVGRTGFGPGNQDWGYVTVRPGAYMFWWLYYVNPTTVSLENSNPFNKPLIVWLQGGPGESGTGYGNFNEIGPLDINLKRRNYTWINDYNVLFIDNPVGTGFSYVDTIQMMAQNLTQVGHDLVALMKVFLEKIPQFKNVPTHIVGESYGGNMAVQFAHLWFQAQKYRTIISNLKGIALGDAPISFKETVKCTAPYLLNLIESIAQKTLKLLNEEQWSEAMKSHSLTYATINNLSAEISMYNILQPKKLTISDSHKYFTSLRSTIKEVNVDSQIQIIMEHAVKRRLEIDHSRNYTLFSDVVWDVLSSQLMKPTERIVEKLLNETNLKIFVYTGQLDLIVPTPSTISWVENLKWTYAEEWNNAIRVPFTVDNIIEGYVKEYKNFKLYWIDRSGHSAAKDNPYAINAMLQDLTSIITPN